MGVARRLGIAGYWCGISLVALVPRLARPSGIAGYQSRFWGVVDGGVCFLAELGFFWGIGWGIDSFGA